MHILTQQCFSILHNTSENIPEGRKIEHLNVFMKDLKLSGYSETDRRTILQGAIQTHLKLKEKEINGIRPYYRSKYNVKNVNKKLKSYKSNWYSKQDDRYKSVMFVEATPNDGLNKMLRNTEEKFMIDKNHRIKFVSKTGSKLINIFQKKDPFQKNCDSKECQPCENTSQGISKLSNCKVNNVCYSATCINCDQAGRKKIYHGETSRNLHIRSKEHTQLYLKRNDQSFMYKHVKNEHGGNVTDVKFKFQVIKKFQKPLQRQLYEAKCIEKTPMHENLNSKDEFNGQVLRRLELNHRKNSLNCKICGHQAESSTILAQHEEKFHEKYSCDYDQCEYISYGKRDLEEHTKVKHSIN